jgi:hypothetical protein
MRFVIVCSVLCLFTTVPAFAQGPGLAEPFAVTLADGTILDVGGIGHAAPTYADYDGDGVPDLVVGEFKDGACRIYRNHGTATAPVYKDYILLTIDGVPATVPPS